MSETDSGPAHDPSALGRFAERGNVVFIYSIYDTSFVADGVARAGVEQEAVVASPPTDSAPGEEVVPQ